MNPPRHETAKTPSTKERILAAAARVFADKGVDAATLREITDAAGTNLASVNYHFGSKDELVVAALTACLRPINQARLRQLEACRDRHAPAPPPLCDVVEALIRPMVTLTRGLDGSRIPIRILLQLRSLPRPETNAVMAAEFDQVHERFIEALQECRPTMTRQQLALRYDFARGAAMQILGDMDPLARELPNLQAHDAGLDEEQLIEQLVSFVVAGFNA